MFLTFKYRIKDASARKHLRRHAVAVNQVWNYCCEVQRKAEAYWKAGEVRRWPSHYDLVNLTAGCSSLLGTHSDTINKICGQFSVSRNANERSPKFRASFGAKRSLGWIPFIPRAAKVNGSVVTYLGRKYHLWLSRPMMGRFRSGAFVEDARGRWYATFQCEIDEVLKTGNGKVGIDLGLKAVATMSDGTAIPALQHYRRYEAALAKASRAGNKRRVRAIHAKIANARRHHLHEQTTKLARENSFIVIGNLNAARLAKTKMAKSILDASWGILRSQLRYKVSRHGAALVEVDEAFTTRTCSSCGSIPSSSPKGTDALRIRSWDCSDCGASHDRDVNAARNILRIGLERQAPVEEMRAA